MRKFDYSAAVVTGAGSGIGYAVAAALAREGVQLALVDIHRKRLANAASRLARMGVESRTYPCDVADLDQVACTIARIVEDFPTVDILINSAGVSISTPFAEVALEDFARLVDVNFWGTVHCSKFLLPHFLNRPNAHIVNVSSCFGWVGFPLKTAYAASKFAVRGFSESLRAELRTTGVGVSLLYPGPVDTHLVRDGVATNAAQKEAELDVVQRRAVPPEVVAKAVVRGIRRNRSRIVVSTDYRVIDLLTRLAPTLAPYLMAVVGNKQVNRTDI